MPERQRQVRLTRKLELAIIVPMTAAYDPHHDWTLEDDDDDVNEDEA